jgi:signal transduction histidine kinase
VDRQVHLIRRAAAVVSGPGNLQAMLEEVLHATVELLGGQAEGRSAGAAVLALVSGGRPRLVSAVGRDPVPDLGLADPGSAAGAALLASAVRSLSPGVTDASGRVGLARVDAAGAPWGVVVAGRAAGSRFSERDLVLLRAIADLAGVAVDSAEQASDLERLRARLQGTLDQLRLAVDAAKEVGFETELDKVTRRLLVRSAEAVGADRASIGRIDGDQLIVEADWPSTGMTRQGPRMMSLAGVADLLETLRGGDPIQHTSTPAGDTPQRHGLQYPLMAGGELVGVMNLSRERGGPFDDTELHALQQLTSLTALNLRSARLLAQARSLGHAKSEFLNMAAHELRTPLAVVRGYLSMMADGTLEVPEKTRNNVVLLLCQKTDELSAMVEQILTAAQIQAGGMQLQRHVFDLREVLNGAIDRARPRAEQVGIELWCQPLENPVPVEAVRVSVGRILDNLIGNAITYGNLLPVRVSVEAEPGADVLVRVEDQGLGMSPEQQERLFEPFFRVDQPSVQGLAGTGLGLAVSRRLAEISGGALDLEWTQQGSGSTFVLRLPAALDPAV